MQWTAVPFRPAAREPTGAILQQDRRKGPRPVPAHEAEYQVGGLILQVVVELSVPENNSFVVKVPNSSSNLTGRHTSPLSPGRLGVEPRIVVIEVPEMVVRNLSEKLKVEVSSTVTQESEILLPFPLVEIGPTGATENVR